MFIGVQAIENNYYIICEVLDADSGSHAVVFLYDFEKTNAATVYINMFRSDSCQVIFI